MGGRLGLWKGFPWFDFENGVYMGYCGGILLGC